MSRSRVRRLLDGAVLQPGAGFRCCRSQSLPPAPQQRPSGMVTLMIGRDHRSALIMPIRAGWSQPADPARCSNGGHDHRLNQSGFCRFVADCRTSRNSSGAGHHRIANLLSMAAVVLIFVTNLHYLMLKSLVDSYTLFLPGQFPIRSPMAPTMPRQNTERRVPHRHAARGAAYRGRPDHLSVAGGVSSRASCRPSRFSSLMMAPQLALLSFFCIHGGLQHDHDDGISIISRMLFRRF